MPDKRRSQYPDAVGHNGSTAAADDLQQLTADQIAAAVGGPTHYGHDPSLSHADTDFTGSAHPTRSRNLAAILDKFKITDQARTEVMAVFASLKSQPVDD